VLWLADNAVAILALVVSISHAGWQVRTRWAQRARLSIHPIMEPEDKQGRLGVTINVKNVGFSPVTIVDWGFEDLEKPCSFRTRWLFRRMRRKSVRGFPILHARVECYTPTVLKSGEAGRLQSEPFTLDGIMGQVWIRDGDRKIYTHTRTRLDLSGRRWPAVRYAALRLRWRLPILRRGR
jgi:hypothetical protein